MADSKLREKTMEFGIAVMAVVNEVQTGHIGWHVIANQVTKSATSIGANVHEAQYAQSRDDFVSKLEIALKECYETEYWLELMAQTKSIDEGIYKALQHDCGEIRRMLIKSCTTAKAGM